IGTVLKALGPFVTIIGKAVSWIGKMGGIINVLRTAFMALTGPIGLTIGVITALVSGIILAYKKSETFRDIIDKVVTAIKNMYNGVKEFLTTNEAMLEFYDYVTTGFNKMKNLLTKEIKQFFDFFGKKFENYVNSGMQKAVNY